MINFFRRIRQQLSVSKNMGKYLLYAGGEIILVVIGILIALSINTWNQQRIAQSEEKVILNNLKEDFQDAIAEFEQLNVIRDTLISGAKKLYALTREDIASAESVYLDKLLSKTLAAPTYNNQAGSLGVLLTSGKIDLIKNKELKKKLIGWPGDVADMVEDEVNHSELYFGKYSDLIDQYILYNDLLKVYNWQSSRPRWEVESLEPYPDNPIVKANYQAMLSNQIYRNTLNRRAVLCQISILESNNLIETANEIINLIEEELKK